MAHTDDQETYEPIDDSSDDLDHDVAEGERARKRAAIGLAPSRPTARAAPQRPPAEDDGSDLSMSMLAWLVGGVLVVTLLLVAAMASGTQVSWPTLRAQVPSRLDVETTGEFTTYDPLLTEPYQRLTTLDFASGATGLAEEDLHNQHQMYADPDEGVYQMRVWPGNLGWSLLGDGCRGPLRVETSALVSLAASDGYAGRSGALDARSFYLFALNGDGEYRVALLLNGEWRIIQPWTESSAINAAGTENVLALTDDGESLTFFSNDSMLFMLAQPELSVGNTGLAGGAVATVADIAFDWVRFYDAVCEEL